jgi:aspartyl/asparaginyl beta-hydroxylase (cupin superfamily)
MTTDQFQALPAGHSERLQKYLAEFVNSDTDPLHRQYPDLMSSPWFDLSDVPGLIELQTGASIIRSEVEAVGFNDFWYESELDSGQEDWEVLFLYECGKRVDEACARFPETTRLIERLPLLRTLEGMVYFSRLAGGATIPAHHGPTNMRVRCHLGLIVPSGSCGVRVAGIERRVQAGTCLLFDDSYDHDVWNIGRGDRTVLIVDLWHPALSADEVRVLEGLQRYAGAHAKNLHELWTLNEAHRGRIGKGKAPTL